VLLAPKVHINGGNTSSTIDLHMVNFKYLKIPNTIKSESVINEQIYLLNKKKKWI